MLLCNKTIIRFFSFGCFKASIFLNRWWYQLHHIRVNTRIISMPANTHDKLSKTKNFVSKIFLYLSFLTAIRGKIKGWVLQNWPFGCWLEVTIVKCFVVRVLLQNSQENTSMSVDWKWSLYQGSHWWRFYSIYMFIMISFCMPQHSCTLKLLLLVTVNEIFVINSLLWFLRYKK